MWRWCWLTWASVHCWDDVMMKCVPTSQNVEEIGWASGEVGQVEHGVEELVTGTHGEEDGPGTEVEDRVLGGVTF